MVCGDQASSSHHIFDDNRRISGNMLADMSSNYARIGVKASSRGKTHDHANSFALVERFLRENFFLRTDSNRDDQKSPDKIAQHRISFRAIKNN
jgi:hypothetical protein